MASNKKTSPLWRVLSSNIFLFLVFLALILASWRLVRLTLKKQSLNQEMANLQNQINTLQGEKQSLSQDWQSANSPEALEKEARRRLNLKKPGENVVVVVPETADSPGDSDNLSQGSGVISPKEVAWWQENLQKWQRYFFGP